MRAAAISVLGLVALTAAGAAQTPPAALPAQTFRATTRLIVQTVTVTDGDGRPIDALGIGDFEITENGRPQTIAFVEYQRLDGDAGGRATLAASAASTSDVPSPTRAQIRVPPPGDARYRGRRLLVLYFDLSTMPTGDRRRAIAGARAYVASGMQPADAIAIITFDGGAVRVREDFTDDRERLLARLDLLAAGGDGNGDGLADDLDEGTAFGENDAEFNVFSTDRQLAALQRAVGELRALPEHKALVYFGSGVRLNGLDNQAQLQATINAAVRANVAISPVDARGLVALPPLGDATRATATGTALFSGALAQGPLARLQRSQDTLYALAKDTGGRLLIDHNDLAAGVVQAAEAVTSYYLLGYYSRESADDGRFRRVRITLRGRSGAKLAYRDGYVADKVFAKFSAADKERQLEDALRMDEPVTDIPLAVEVNAFRLNRSEYYVPVALKIPGRELTLARGRGAARTIIDVIGEIKDDHGITHRNVRDKLEIPLDEANAAALAGRPLQYETGFTLLPGAYVLKLLVRDGTTGRLGTYQLPFAVRNVARDTDAVPMSSVVLGSQWIAAADALYTVRQKVATDAVNPLIIGGRRLIPSVTRVFSMGRDMRVFLQAYRTEPARPQPIAAYAGLYRDGVKARETSVTVDTGVDPKAETAPLMLTMPLSGLEPGVYECQVTVVSPATGRASFWRADVVLVR